MAAPLLRLTLAGLVAGAVVASLVVGVLNEWLTTLLLQDARARAVDQLELGALTSLTTADFAPPYTPEHLASLADRLEPLRERVLRDGSGVIRVNVFARDGTLLYSDLPAHRGQHIDPDDAHLLASALAGTVASERSSLSDPENGDLRADYGSALEVYVPVVRDGRVVGAYELYQDLRSVRWLLLVAWAAVAASVAAAVWVAVRLLRPAVGPATAAHPPPVAPPGLLTPRELEVLHLMPSGLSNREIAAVLVVSEETVRSHVKHILRKLEQTDRTAAVVTAMRIGLLRLDEPASASPKRVMTLHSPHRGTPGIVSPK